MYKYFVSVRALYSKFTARAPPTQKSFRRCVQHAHNDHDEAQYKAKFSL